mgnify:FL=1
MIESLLGVVDPMLMQSEKVAASGMGDAGQVASAQRTVSMMRVTHSDVAKKLAQSKLTLKNHFDSTLEKIIEDYRLISRALLQGAPAQLAGVASDCE